MTREAFMKGNTSKPVPVEIRQGLVSERNEKRITNLSKNEKIYEQGDGIMKIAPFDNYYLFTIYSELNLENVPVDLHNMGSFFLTFKDKSSEVRIENFKNTKDVNPAGGEILFRISQEEAEKILSLDTNIYYVTSFLYDNNSKSDETVIYSGRFAEYNDASLTSLTDEIERLKNELDTAKAEKVKIETELRQEINELSDTLVQLRNEYASTKEDLDTYRNLYEELCKNVQNTQSSQNTENNQETVEEKSNQKQVEKIDRKLKEYQILQEAKKDPTNKIVQKNAVSALKQTIIGIRPQVVDLVKPKTDIVAKQTSIKDAKLSLANIIVKKGVIVIYAFVNTKYGDLDTETEVKEYNNLVELYNSTGKFVNENKYNNIEYNTIFTETDYGKLIGKYNVNSNCIVVTKDGNKLGTVQVNNNSTAVDVLQQIDDIITQNNN